MIEILENEEDTGVRFHSVPELFHPWNFLLGLLGWREKCGFVSLLSKSPLGQLLVPGMIRMKTNFGAEVTVGVG